MGDYTKYTNKALVKVGDKFCIDYIIDMFKNISNVEFVVTLGYCGDLVKEYLSIAYSNHRFTFLNVDNYDGVGSSQGYSTLQAKDHLQEPFVFVACDTIIQDAVFTGKDHAITCNKLYVSKRSDTTNYASVKCLKERILSFHDKGEINTDYVYVGMCEIYTYGTFWTRLEELYLEDPMNEALGDTDVYKTLLPDSVFEYRLLERWWDGGNISIFDSALHASKNYNVLAKLRESITFLDDKVVKFFWDSKKNKRLLTRAKLFEDISPKILDCGDNFYSMEKINSKPASEYFDPHIVYNILKWALKNVWIPTDKSPHLKEAAYRFYHDKTVERIDKARELCIYEYSTINQQDIGDINSLLLKLDFEELCNMVPVRFHGDFILDNILLHPEKTGEFLLIDWREDFGGNLETGDIYYDLAKFKHNMYLNHSNVENKLFDLVHVDSSSCLLDLKCNFILIEQIRTLENFVSENNMDNHRVNLLMSLIWINMAPLHEYPLNTFLLNFGKYNLYKYVTEPHGKAHSGKE